jgi:rubrerythrin
VTNVKPSSLDSALFADGPARDARFRVAERWADCANFPEGHPLREIEFFHRQMNEEVDSLECSAGALIDFPEAEWAQRLGLARQCADEARHAAMFRRIFESRGGRIGEYPILNFQYRIIARIRSLVGRLAIQNRSFEAGGLDAIAFGIEQARQRGDEELAQLFEAQRADEIVHVRFANEWIRVATQRDPRSVLQIGTALAGASKAFFQVMGSEGTEGVTYPADVAGRREAGFSDDEVGLAIQLQGQPAGGQAPRM